jgi:uncharacterized delta-60 repeat protein/uncharacterized repeat protein (TIGR01451 family)
MGLRRLAGWTAAALLAVPAIALAAPDTPDPGFGTGGTVLANFTGRTPSAAGMTLDGAGRPVVVAKTGPMELGVMRLLPDGKPDPAFHPAGQPGAVTMPLGATGESLLTDVAVQADGRYLVGGWIEETPGDRRFALVRFSATGDPDATFRFVRDRLDAGDDEIHALALQPDQKIVAAGRAGDRIGVARYTPSGAVDPAFTQLHDVGGPAVTGEEASGVVVEPSGRILLAGTGVVAGERRFLLAALTPTGTADLTFGTGGYVTLDVGDGAAAVRTMKRQADGKLLVAGSTDGAGGGGGVLVRFLPDGTPDPSFSTDGIARLGVPGAIAEDIAVQPDGKVVAVGAADSATGSADSLIARFRPGGAHDPGFGTGGVVRRSLGPAGPDRLTGVGVAADGGIVGGGLVGGAGASLAVTRLTGGDSSDPALAMTAKNLGTLVTFTISASNPGADPARDVKVTVAPPPGLAASALSTAAGGCAGGVCSVGTLAPGATARMTLLARAKRLGPLTASASVAGATFDADPGNNTASATGTATPNRVVRRDRTKPAIKLRLRSKRLKQIRRHLTLRVKLSEPGSARFTVRSGTGKRAKAFVSTRRVSFGRKGNKRVTLKLTTAGRKAVKQQLKRKQGRRLTLTIAARATDRAGNKRAATLRRTLRR